MPIPEDKTKNNPVSATAPPVSRDATRPDISGGKTALDTSEPRANDYTLTGDQDTDLDNIASHYKPADLDDNTWRGMWKSVFAGESGSNLDTGDSTYGKLPKGQRATGGMQVTPKTGKGLGFTDEELKDPYYNFMAGVKNLRTEWDEIGKDKRVTSPEHRAALTFAAYHAGRGNVLASLNKGEDGVPNVDDGGINTRDYAFNKFDYLKNYLKDAGPRESEYPQLVSDEELAARGIDESGQPARENKEQPGATVPQMKRAGSVMLGNINAPAARKSMEEELVDSDRRTREALGLIVPSTAPRNFTGKAPNITMEVRRAQDGSLDVDENTLTDAVVFALTGDNNLGQQFRQSVGENPGTFNYDITKQWLNEQVQAGNLRVSEVDGRLFVQGNVPVQNYVKNRLEAFAHEGAPGVARVTSEMAEETSQYERLAAEEGYGRRIMELRAQAETSKDASSKAQLTQQADALEAELEAKYPTNWLDETWRGFKTGLARGAYNVSRTGMNIKGLVEALGMSDKEKVEATNRDKRVRAMEAALNAETPQARRWLGQAADAVTSELVYTPIYIGGGMMMGPAGGIMTQALRSANKPMDEAMEDIVAAVFELGAGSLIKGKWLAGSGISHRKEFLAEMGIGGFTEAGGDALVSLAEGKGIDWNNALMNLVIGAGMEAGFGAREALKRESHAEGEGDVKFDTESAGAVQFDTEVRSPVFITRGENGQPRFGAVVRQGNSVGFIEIPNQHPIILKHTIDVEEGKASFVATDAENFDKALTDWKESGDGIKLPKLNAAQLAQYLRGENPLVTEKRDAKLKSLIDNGVPNDSANIEGQVSGEVGVGQEPVQANSQQGGSGETASTSGVLQTPSGEQVSGQQTQVQTQGTNGQATVASKGQGNEQVLNEPKTYRKYKNIQHALDRDLAQQWDKAKEERDEAYKGAVTGQNGELNQGAMIRAGHVFTAARRDILAEQEKRDKAKEQTTKETKKTTTKEEKPFEAGRVVSTGGVNVTLPPKLAARWNQIQDDFKGAKKAVEEDDDLTLDEKKQKVNEIKRQKLDEQTRIMNEYKKQQEESEQRGYVKGSNRPLKIVEDRGDEVEVKLAGEDATRVMSRDEIETRKERTLARTSKTKLPLSVRTKSFFGTFRETKAASHASDGVVYINSSMQSKIEDALGEEIGTGYTLDANKVDDTSKTLRDAGLNKLADQLESQKKTANGAPAIVNVNTEVSGLALAHERVHQSASSKDLPRTVVERLMKDGGNIDKMLNEVDDHPIKDLDPNDVVHEILAYGLTGDFDTLGVAPDFLYDALLDVVEAYVGAFPNEDLDAIFDKAVVDIDTIKDEANRRIKYGAENKFAGSKAVQATGNKAEAGQETGGEGSVAGEVSKRAAAGRARAESRAKVEAEDTVENIQRKPDDEVTPMDVKTIVNKGRFAAISGGEKTGKLKNELDRMGFKVFEAEGNYKSGKKTKSEPSLFVILNAPGDEAQLIRLATRFKQANVLLGDAGKYRSPFTSAEKEAVSSKNKALFEEEADKQAGNTLVKTENGDMSFSIPDIDSDIRPSEAKEREDVAELTRAYEKSFENKAKATTADLTQFLQEQMDLKKRKQRQVAEVGQFLEQTVRDMYGEYPDETLPQGEYDAQRARRAQHDLLSILEYEFGHSNKDADETGMSWYTSSIEKMHQRTGQAFPEVLNMPQMRLLYDLTLALSSPANKVNSNYKYTAQLWTRMIDEFELGMEGPRIYPTRQKAMTRDKETGQMRPKKYGKFGPLLDKFNNMSEGYIPIPSTEVDKVKESGAEMRQTSDFADVKGATQWYAKEPELDRLIKKYGKIGGVFEYLLQPGKAENEPFRATELLGPKVGAFFLNIAGFSQLVTVDSWISRWFYMLNGGLVNESEKYGVQDSPKNDRDGDLIRGVMQATAKEWNKNNSDMQISPEDVQAMAWYHIKNIFFLAGAKDSGNVDFHQAAQNVLAQPEIVADIDGTAANRDAVLERFKQDAANAVGPRAAEAGTAAAGRRARDFFVQQMASPARSGLAHTKRKDVVNRKLNNFDSVEWNKFIERAKGDELDVSEKKALYSLLQKGYQATTEKQRTKVKEQLIDFANSVSSQSLAEFLLTVRKAGMLSGVKTTGRNILSNLAYGILEEGQRGIAGPIDAILAVARKQDRSVQGVSPMGIWRGLRKSITEGLPEAWQVVKKGNGDLTTFEDVGYDPKLRPYLSVFGKKVPFATGAWFMNKTIGNYAKYIFRFQKAQDIFFRTYAYNRAMYEVAALKEKNQKVPIADTLANPTAQESDAAWRAAEVMVFQNENAMNTAYQRFKSKQPKAVKYLLDYQLPFIKTGSNIFNATMDYLGIGGAYKIAKLAKEMEDADWAKGKSKLWAAIDNPEARKIIVGAFSRGMVGLGIATIGWFLAAAGALNGMDDDDEKERQRRIAEGSGPGHIKINGTWNDIRGISPVGTILLSGASAWRAMNKDMKDESKRFDAMLAVASSILVDGLPLARAASDYVNPKSGRSVVQRAIGAESLVPAIVSEYGAHRDTVQRNTKGDTLKESVKNSVKARIPGKREELPAKTDVFGRELEQPSGFNPLSTKKAKDDKVLKEASDVGWSMTPPKRDTKNKETAPAFEKRKKKIEDLVYKIFDKVISDPGYSSDFTKPERKEILDEAAGIARRTVKNEGKLTDNEIKDVVKAVLEKAKVEAGIDRDAKMGEKEKSKAKQAVSSQFSSFIGGPTRD